MVLREADGLHLQGEGQEERIALPLHLGQGQQASWKQRHCSSQVQVQLATQIYGIRLDYDWGF